jgi:anti-anti-sigma factor
MVDILADRREGGLILGVSGRLDGFGAQQLQEAIEKQIRDDDRWVIIEMTGVPYLSSAGIRIFLAGKKRLKERNGTLVLCNVQDFPRNVLDMAGFLNVIDIYPSVAEAVTACSRAADRFSLLRELAHPSVTREGVRFTIEPASTGAAALNVTGSLEKVLLANLTEQDIRSLRFSECNYSLGLGSLGRNIAEAMPLLGEMITLHGSMVWVPTDGNMTPDFFTPVKDTGEVQIFTGFNIALQGSFHDIISVECEGPEGIRINDLYQALFALAKERNRKFSGIMTIAMWAIPSAVYSSEIRHAPLRDLAPANHRSIMDPENFTEWNATNTEPRYDGDTMVSFGVGIDLTYDLSQFKGQNLQSMYYIHPANRESQKVYLHNHGVIFRNIPWDPGLDLDRQIKRIVNEGEFVDMRHLLDETRIRRAKCGVTYISAIHEDR